MHVSLFGLIPMANLEYYSEAICLTSSKGRCDEAADGTSGFTAHQSEPKRLMDERRQLNLAVSIRW